MSGHAVRFFFGKPALSEYRYRNSLNLNHIEICDPLNHRKVD